MLNSYFSWDKSAWEGIVLDLSTVPLEKASGLLEALAPPGSATGKQAGAY
jgi:hypothetical protein